MRSQWVHSLGNYWALASSGSQAWVPISACYRQIPLDHQLPMQWQAAAVPCQYLLSKEDLQVPHVRYRTPPRVALSVTAV